MNNFYPQQTKVITKRTPSLFSMALKALGILLLFMGWSGIVSAQQFHEDSPEFSSSGSFTVPAGVTEITVEAWGGGGGGGNRTSNGQAGGGGGGAYAKSVLAVTPNTEYEVKVGSGGTSGNPGTASSFGDVVVAAGGKSPGVNIGNGAPGGSVEDSKGDAGFVFAGGKGGDAGDSGGWFPTYWSGGGGGGAGSSGNGKNASGETGGSGTSEHGGAGGSGRTSRGNGNPGLTYGGGGSGDFKSNRNNYTGGNGASGFVRITYSAPNYLAKFESIYFGSLNWQPGETRQVSVTVTNMGYQTWTDNSPDINIGVKWNGDPDYLVRTDANNLTPGETRTYTFTVTAPSTLGANNLTFNVIKDETLFSSNTGDCGPGNEVFKSQELTIVPSATRFYSYKTGSWDDASTWTLDPSGTQLLNPSNLTPATSPTKEYDEVVILSGRTVTIAENDKANGSLVVNGTLNVGLTTGHSFTTIAGTGRIRLAADNFPDGDATHFVSAGQGQGTVEYYGSIRNLDMARTYYNVEVNMSAANTLTLLKDYTINGNLTISNGTFSINNNASTTALNIRVNGDVTVAAQGKIVTGTANARHQLNLYGNFTNNGEARFTNRTSANYSAEATDGIVDVNFLSGNKDQSLMCNGITNFYRIKIDKGVDQTYTLNMDATDVSKFNLFGAANYNHGAENQLTANNNAFGLIRGTVRVGNSIEIPVLSNTTGNYNISENAQLWIDGGTVRKNTGTAIVVNGKVKVTSGTLEAKINSGLTFRGNGIINVEGGTVNVNQIRTSIEGTVNYGGYVQTGGTVNVLGGDITNASYYAFSLPTTTSVFNMSGGTLKVSTSNGKGGIFINSAAENVKVTGGTVIAEANGINKDFLITSTAPFWNLLLKNSSTVARNFTLGAADAVGTPAVTIDAQPLRVLNEFRIWGKESGGSSYPATTFNPGTTDVYIGGSFFVENGAQYLPISGGAAPYDNIANQPTERNTTHFIKTSATKAVEQFYRGDAVNPLELGNLVVDRTSGHEVKMTSAASRVNETVVLDVNGNATVLSGTLNQNLFTIRTWGAIINNGRMGTWYPSVTPSRAQIQFVENSNLTLSTSSNAVFGNVQVNVTPPSSVLTLTSDVYIERMEYVKGLIYLKGFNLKVDNLWSIDPGIFENSANNSYLKILNNGHSGNSMIYTDGKASDGGLTLRVAANSQPDNNQPNRLNNTGPTTYPLGFTSDGGTTLYFRPAQMMVSEYSSPGYVTIRPVMGALQTTSQSGGSVLQHYWRVSHSGFNTLPKVSFRFYYRNRTGVANVDLVSGTDANYVPGKVLDENPYTRGSEPAAHNDIIRDFGAGNNSRIMTINGTNVSGQFSNSSGGITLENANYTAGLSNRFTGSVMIYYSIDNNTIDENRGALWNRPASWTRSDILNQALISPHHSGQPKSTTIPGAGDVVVIGWVPWNDTKTTLRGQPHNIWLTDPREVAEVVFTKMTNAAGEPVERVYRSNFQFRPTLTINGRDNQDNQGGTDNGALTAKLVKGEGLFWNRQTDPDYTKMDIGDFARQDSSYVIYENFTNNRTINNTPALFPNLYISNDLWGANDLNFTFAKDIVTTGNVELLGNVNLLLPTGATGDITAGRNLVMFQGGTGAIGNRASGGGAEIGYGNAGTARKIVVKGDLIMANTNSVIHVKDPNGGDLVDHELHVHGNIIQGTSTYASTGLRLWTGANQDRITLYLNGDKSMTYNRVNGAIPALYRVVVNKGNSPATTARFNTDFTLNGPTSGVGTPKALELQNGTFIYNNTTNATRELILTTGNDNFSIPSTAGLEIIQGTVRASGSSGISLDGKLTIRGGTLDMSGGDNPIEYSASGNATIEVTGGELIVGGQIRRSPTSEVGILRYEQTGGSVIAGNNAATVNNRGVFEVLNPGSSFNMTGGNLHIARSQTNPTISAFYFNPEVYSIGASANIHIGHDRTPTAQTIGVYAGKPLPALRINNESGNNPVAKLEVVSATINSLLNIDAGAVFNANGLDLTLNGNLTASGTYIPNSNTTFFSGSGAQTIEGAVTFYNLDKTTSNNLVLTAGNTPLIVSNKLSLLGGTFTDNGNTITVMGNLTNNATHVNNGSGDGISLNGIAPQILEGNGTFGKLTINNPGGVSIPVGNEFTITRSLKMQAGILNIGSNLLNIGQNGIIEQASPFSSANMIETNLSFTDNGLRKVFPAGNSGEFTFPVGSNDKYTPVTFNITANSNSGGSITVKPANEMHASIVEDNETGVQIVDKDNALQYYWTLKAEGLTGFSAGARMRYIDTDVKVTAPYTVADYHTAVLLANGEGEWLKFYQDDFDEDNKELIFKFSDTDDVEISGDYTAGAGDESLDGAIPNEVAKYETNRSGDWTDGSLWSPSVSGGPRGAIAKINIGHIVDLPPNPVSGYMTEVYGTAKLYSTFGHRLGIVNGTGTISMETGQIPAAVYDNFFSSAGGTLEFGGSSGYEFLGNVPMVNHLILSGTGERRLPNNNLTLNGNLTIDGGASLSIKNFSNKRVSLKGNLSLVSGSFEAGSGANATLAFIGTLNQTISGSFINANALNNLEIDNANGVTVANDLDVKTELKLIKGRINVAPESLFRIKQGAIVSPEAGSSTSYVNGKVTKEMMTGNSFTFPVGDQTIHGPIGLQAVTGPAGINNWKVAYYFANATLAGYDTESFESSISTVSHTEYWKIEAPTGGAARIRIILNGSSDVAATAENLSYIRVVGWNAISEKWEIVGSGAAVTGTATAGTVTTTTSVNFGNYTYFTLASLTPADKGIATITTAPVVDLCSGSSTTIKVAFSGEAPYVLTYNAGGTSITTQPISATSYDITVTPLVNTVYTLTGVTANGVAGEIKGTVSATVNVKPVPDVLLSRSGSGAICQGTSITFTATAGLGNYLFRVDGITVQNGANNTYTATSLSAGIHSIDVTGTNSSGCSATSSAVTVTVNPLPAAAGAISGPASVCRNSNGIYSVPEIANATSYVWSADNGATISGAGRTRTINFSNAGTSTITVYGTNGCGNGVSSTFTVAVNTASTPGNAGAISGVSEVCKGGTGYTFNVGTVENATSYIWNYSGTGATINGTGNSVTIDFASNATNGNLTVRGTNGCADGGVSANYAITTNTPPTATILPTTPSVCSGSSVSITATPAGGASGYTHAWTGAGAGSLSSTTSTNPIFANPVAGDYELIYTVTDLKGCKGSAATTVKVFPAPVANAGPDALDLCTGTSPIAMTGASASGSYTGQPTWSGIGGTWTQNPDPALATFTPSTTSGSTIATLTLTGANGCDNVSDTREISWNTEVGQPAAFTESKISVCPGEENVVYTVPNDPLADSYSWNYNGTGVTINGNGNSVTINFSSIATSGKLSVTATNACNTSAARTLDITVNPVTSVTLSSDAEGEVCTSSPVTFTATPGAGTWTNFEFFLDGSTVQSGMNTTCTLSGLIHGQKVTVVATNNFSCSVTSNEVTISVISTPGLWTGSQDSDWNNGANWCNGSVPAQGTDIMIYPGVHSPEMSGTLETGDLMVSAGATFTLNPGGQLTVNGNLNIADVGGLILKNTAEINGLASLMTNGSINGDARIELEFPYDEWYYVSQPIANAQSDIYAILNGDDSFNTSEAWINVHRANRWYRIGTGVSLADFEGVSNKYRPADHSNHVVSYTGKLNNGPISRNFTKRQYYLFGNPYPSAINWQEDTGWERNNIGGTIWYRTRVKGEMAFVTYNRFSKPGARAAVYPDQGDFGDETMLAYIPPLQSVWMASLGESSVSINNDARSHAPNGTFLKSSRSTSSTSNVIRIISENEHSYDGAVLYFSDNAEEGIDRGDSEKMFNESVNIPEVYTRVGGKAMAINGLAPFEGSLDLPLSVRNRVKGPVDLNFDLSLYRSDDVILLHDQYLDKEINLREVQQYRYEPFNLDDNHDRFVIRFNPEGYEDEDISTPVDDISKNNSDNLINITGANGRAIVSIDRELLQERAGQIEVFNVAGSKISEFKANTNKTFIVLPEADGVYLVVVKAGDKMKSKKLIR